MKYFSTVSYMPDGLSLIAGGPHWTICLYNVEHGTLLRKWFTTPKLPRHVITSDHHEPNILRLLKGKTDTDIPDSLELEKKAASMLEEGRTVNAQVRALVRSPNGRQFSCITTGGVLMFSLDNAISFHPLELDMDVTSDAIKVSLEDREFAAAFIMAVRLNNNMITRQVCEGIIPLVVSHIPVHYIQQILLLFSSILEESPHIELHLMWIYSIFSIHGRELKESVETYRDSLRLCARTISHIGSDILWLSDNLGYQITYMLQHSK